MSQNFGSERLVVGAHYGMRDWLSQRVTAILMALFTLLVLARLLLARGPIADGSLIDLVPGRSLPIQLYWHCWNLESELLDTLSEALTSAASRALLP